MPKSLQYGDIVEVIDGKWAGIVGVFDDHDDKNRMVITLGPIGISPYVTALEKHVRKADAKQAEAFARESLELQHGYSSDIRH